MRFSETSLVGAYTIDLEPIEDDRGFFARSWAADELQARGLEDRVVQGNLAYNKRRGTLRGMHLQKPPHEEVKFVRCIRGALHDVIVDLRKESPTFLQWAGFDLTEKNRRMLYVPKGFAHGYQTLADDTEAFYLVTEFHVPGSEIGLRWDDPSVGIDWPLEPTEISEKDRSWPDL